MFAGTHVRYTRDVGVVRYELRNDHSTAASTDSLWRRQIHNEIRKRFQNTAAFAVSILPIDPAHHECGRWKDPTIFGLLPLHLAVTR